MTKNTRLLEERQILLSLGKRLDDEAEKHQRRADRARAYRAEVDRVLVALGVLIKHVDLHLHTAAFFGEGRVMNTDLPSHTTADEIEAFLTSEDEQPDPDEGAPREMFDGEAP